MEWGFFCFAAAIGTYSLQGTSAAALYDYNSTCHSRRETLAFDGVNLLFFRAFKDNPTQLLLVEDAVGDL